MLNTGLDEAQAGIKIAREMSVTSGIILNPKLNTQIKIQMKKQGQPYAICKKMEKYIRLTPNKGKLE